MARYLVTGAAGFIASRVCELLMDAGHGVVGLDNMNDAYDTRLKDYRLARLKAQPGFVFHEMDVVRLDPPCARCSRKTPPAKRRLSTPC